VDVTDPAEQVVFDLKIEAAQAPAEHPVAAGEVDGGADLVLSCW